MRKLMCSILFIGGIEEGMELISKSDGSALRHEKIESWIFLF